MNTYDVHVYTQVHVKVTGVKAENMGNAIEKAENAVDFHDLLDNKRICVSKYPLGDGMFVSGVTWAEEGPDNYLVDALKENGETDYDKTCWFGPDRLPLFDGKTTDERKLTRANLAVTFMKELLDSVDTLSGIADEHGQQTLVDLMYLQNAILEDGFIDVYPDASKVLDIIGNLPSADKWMKFVKVEYLLGL